MTKSKGTIRVKAKTARAKARGAKVTKKPAKAAKKITKKKRAAKKRAAKKLIPPVIPAPVGAVVSGTDPCVCGDSPEDHGHDATHPGSTACTVEGCDCIAYEASPEPNESDEPRA